MRCPTFQVHLGLHHTADASSVKAALLPIAAEALREHPNDLEVRDRRRTHCVLTAERTADATHFLAVSTPTLLHGQVRRGWVYSVKDPDKAIPVYEAATGASASRQGWGEVKSKLGLSRNATPAEVKQALSETASRLLHLPAGSSIDLEGGTVSVKMAIRTKLLG